MTNIVCLLYVGWVTNYIASVYVKVQEPISEKKLEEDKGDTLRIIERLDHLENVIKQHIQEVELCDFYNMMSAIKDYDIIKLRCNRMRPVFEFTEILGNILRENDKVEKT
ncbi:hypothetical protein DUI87_25384 [Hirundo rustica rustica]|uniref:Uncharacterized protein n=1 Tax=Hirundo rustica rustica TaxID=333673 RepID=A0A3M0JSR9_HIRRU|nr:hypothetical protein DUI87_25384 [Hirundo rustica rustica]